MTLALSQRINSEVDLRILATNGLGVRDYVIDRHLHNQRHDITEAALKVIGVRTLKVHLYMSESESEFFL